MVQCSAPGIKPGPWGGVTPAAPTLAAAWLSVEEGSFPLCLREQLEASVAHAPGLRED